MKKLELVLRTDYAPDVCSARLAEQIDLEKRTIFSLSGYKGKRPVIGVISGLEFRIQKRRYWRNDFAPVLYGRMVAEGRGARVESYCGISRMPRIFLRIWLIFAALTGIPIFISSLMDLIAGKPSDQAGLYIGLFVPPGLILLGILLPRIGQARCFGEKRYLVEFLERTLSAGRVPGETELREWRSSLE